MFYSSEFQSCLILTFLALSIWEDLVNTITLHKLPVSSCYLIVVFSTSESRMSSMLIFVWPFWTFKLAQGQAITLQELPVSFHNFTDILYIKISDKFDVDLCLTFWTRSCSNGSILQFLVNMIMPQNVPASCCNFTGSDVLIRISAKFDVWPF